MSDILSTVPHEYHGQASALIDEAEAARSKLTEAGFPKRPQVLNDPLREARPLHDGTIEINDLPQNSYGLTGYSRWEVNPKIDDTYTGVASRVINRFELGGNTLEVETDGRGNSGGGSFKTERGSVDWDREGDISLLRLNDPKGEHVFSLPGFGLDGVDDGLQIGLRTATEL